MLKKYILLVCLIATHVNNPEYLLCKINPKTKSIEPLSYNTMSDKEKSDLWNLYYKTIYRYQWPTVIRFYNPSKFWPNFNQKNTLKNPNAPELTFNINFLFSKDEQRQYLQALERKPYGLFNFIKNKVEVLSNTTYSVIWVPTTIFELYLLSSINSQTAMAYESNKLKYLNPSAQESFPQYCHTIDNVIQHYRIDNKVITHYNPSNQSFIISLIDQLINKILTNFSTTDIYFMEKTLLSLNIIKKHLEYEQEAFENNQCIFVRGTAGYSPENINTTVIDYKLGSSIGLSYGYSLFAGALFESAPRAGGAQAFNYLFDQKIGYALLININDYFLLPYKLAYIFTLPPLTTAQGIFGRGENFHPRVNDISNLSQRQQDTMILHLSNYLAQAKLIKLYKGKDSLSDQILKEDIQDQIFMLKNEALQKRITIEAEEALEFKKILEEFQSLPV